MATKSKKRSKKEEKIEDKEPRTAGDFEVSSEHYEQLGSFEVYATERKITKLFGVKEKGVGKREEPYLKAQTRYKSPHGWTHAYGIHLHGSGHVARFIHGLLQLARKLGWKVKQAEEMESVKQQLRESEEAIIRLEATNTEMREEHEHLMVVFREKQEAALRSRVDQFEQDIKDFEGLIARSATEKVAEQELQEFLFAHPWLFGTEYINAEPQKFRGAHSKFDFYLERFNKTNDIVEIKLVSVPIINKDSTISAGVTQAVDQVIGYMESSQAAAHSTVISREEGIRELRPRGIVIIGGDDSAGAKEKLASWNYQLAHITILTYRDVLVRGKEVVTHLKKQNS